MDVELEKLAVVARPRPVVEGPYHRSFAVRAGVGGHTGVLGVGVEWRPSFFGLAVGTGTHLLSCGLTFGPPANEGGIYADLHFTRVSAGFFGTSTVDGIAFGATLGYDLRPLPWLSVKAGAGVVQNSAKAGSFTWDLNVGPVF